MRTSVCWFFQFANQATYSGAQVPVITGTSRLTELSNRDEVTSVIVGTTTAARDRIPRRCVAARLRRKAVVQAYRRAVAASRDGAVISQGVHQSDAARCLRIVESMP